MDIVVGKADWFTERVEAFASNVTSASDIARELLDNWQGGRTISSEYPGMDLQEAMLFVCPSLDRSYANILVAIATKRSAMPEETSGMNDKAVRALPGVTTETRGRPEKATGVAFLPSTAPAIDPAKVVKAREVIVEARERSGGDAPTAAAIKEVMKEKNAPRPKGPKHRTNDKSIDMLIRLLNSRDAIHMDVRLKTLDKKLHGYFDKAHIKCDHTGAK